jgi:pimeloyl-ACP methyl ester carboxylesterase
MGRNEGTVAEAGHLDVDGLRLEYRMLGPSPESAPTIVMLHEGLGSVSMWRDFPDRVAKTTGFGVFVYSRMGYGSSSPCEVPRPLTYMHDEALNTLPCILDAIGFHRGIVLGHSDGASIAAIHAGECRDERVRGLILMAPHFFTEDAGIESIARTKSDFESSDLRARLYKHHGENVDGAFWGWNRAWLDPEFRRWDIREYLGKIRVPVLIVQGEDDEYGSEEQIEAARAQCRAPVEAVLSPLCGHSPHRDQPERTLAEIAAFSGRVIESSDSAPSRPTSRTDDRSGDVEQW